MKISLEAKRTNDNEKQQKTVNERGRGIVVDVKSQAFDNFASQKPRMFINFSNPKSKKEEKL